MTNEPSRNIHAPIFSQNILKKPIVFDRICQNRVVETDHEEPDQSFKNLNWLLFKMRIYL